MALPAAEKERTDQHTVEYLPVSGSLKFLVSKKYHGFMILIQYACPELILFEGDPRLPVQS